MGISCCVTGCTSNYSRRGENSPHVTVFKFPDNEDLRRKWILNIPRKLDKITQPLEYVSSILKSKMYIHSTFIRILMVQLIR